MRTGARFVLMHRPLDGDEMLLKAEQVGGVKTQAERVPLARRKADH